jgi:DNA-binding winged helix-turn-helix (wHTH) protein
MVAPIVAPVHLAPTAPWSFTERVQEAEAPLRFREYLLLPSERVLLRRGEPVEIGSRAFDLLTILTKFRGKLVTKNEIVKFVWPSTIVEESNLRFQMASLRRVLAADRDMIKTIPGRGYLFVAEPGDERSEQVELVHPTTRLGSSDRATAEDGLQAKVERVMHQVPASSRVGIVVLHGDESLRELVASITQSMNLHDGEAYAAQSSGRP